MMRRKKDFFLFLAKDYFYFVKMNFIVFRHENIKLIGPGTADIKLDNKFKLLNLSKKF